MVMIACTFGHWAFSVTDPAMWTFSRIVSVIQH